MRSGEVRDRSPVPTSAGRSSTPRCDGARAQLPRRPGQCPGEAHSLCERGPLGVERTRRGAADQADQAVGCPPLSAPLWAVASRLSLRAMIFLTRKATKWMSFTVNALMDLAFPYQNIHSIWFYIWDCVMSTIMTYNFVQLTTSDKCNFIRYSKFKENICKFYPPLHTTICNSEISFEIYRTFHVLRWENDGLSVKVVTFTSFVYSVEKSTMCKFSHYDLSKWVLFCITISLISHQRVTSECGIFHWTMFSFSISSLDFCCLS